MIPWLNPTSAPYFPDTSQALLQPNGLLAAGGKLSVDWLLVAYRQGIFPWFSKNEPILWWSPAPRTVLLPDRFHTSRSLKRLAGQNRYHFTRNEDFETVIRNCALPRKTQAETWIIDEMIDAYLDMHKAGFAHSIECRDADDKLVGGVYGIILGRIFFGESMFSQADNASKLCLKYLCECGDFELIDCQMTTDHLTSLGAIEIERQDYEAYLNQYCEA